MSASSQPPSIAGTPLVGREREQAVLRGGLADVLAGRGALVLIGGEAGIGKTTVAEWLLNEATAQGALALTGRCYDLSETPPYGPWREAFARAPRDATLPALPGVVLPAQQEGDTLTSQEAICARIRDYLVALATGRPLIVLLDDLHWADAASLDLLRFLGRGGVATPLLLLVTYRTDELTRRHPLYALLPLLVREVRATRLELRPLGPDNLRALLQRYVLSPAEEERLLAYLIARAEGNSFYAGEFLRMLEETGALRAAGAGGALGDLAGVRMPALLRQVLDARLDRLGEEARGLLATAAVIGQEIPLDLWAAVAGTNEDALLDTIERAVDARLLGELPGGAAVRFAHALIRETLYEGTLATRRRRAHRQVAEAIAAAPQPDPDAVAHHFQQAGDARAVPWLLRSGERAQAAYAWATAIARYEAALRIAGDEDVHAPTRARLLFRLGGLLRLRDSRRGVEALDEAARLLDARAEPALAARIQLYRGLVRCILGDLPAGLALLRDAATALEALPADARVGDIILDAVDATNDVGTVVLWLAIAGYLAEAEALGTRLLGPASLAAEPGSPVPAHADPYAALGHCHAYRGQAAAARAAYMRAHACYQSAGHLSLAGATAFNLLCNETLVYEADDLVARARVAAMGERDWMETGAEVMDFPTRVAWLPVLEVEGTWAEIQALGAGLAPAYAQDVDPIVAQVALWQGEANLTSALIARRLPGGAGTAPGAAPFFAALKFQRLAVALAMEADDLAGAQSWLEAHDRWLTWGGATLGLAEGHLGWATYHRAAGDVTAARGRAEQALAHAGRPRQPLALLAAHRFLGEIDTAEGRHGGAQAHLDAALALAEACAAPYEHALTLLALAELRAATGDHDASARALHEARTILAPLEARPALARADARAARLAAPVSVAPASAGAPFGLTTREVEILRLVAQGHANVAIADRLSLSRRTVEQHLRNAYDKLGVDNRAAATRLAVERGLA